MMADGALAFPAYAAPRRHRSIAPALVVAALHVLFVVLAQTAARPAPRPRAAPADPAEPVMVLILPEDTTPGATPGSARTRSGAPVPHAARAAANGAGLDSRYLASGKLDIGPVPASAPDFASVMSRSISAGTVRLRVYVSGFGAPDRVEVLGAPIDTQFAQALRHALEQTSFLPGRLGGHDVAAYVDYEFQTELVVLPPVPNRRPS